MKKALHIKLEKSIHEDLKREKKEKGISMKGIILEALKIRWGLGKDELEKWRDEIKINKLKKEINKIRSKRSG